MSHRIHNFGAGPATLPLPVLEQVKEELLDFSGTGMSIMEISHRTKEYEAVNAEAESLFKELLGAPDDYRVLFLQGGASLQFAMVPMGFLKQGETADYILTGTWSEKAYEEAKKLGDARIAASTADEKYVRIPDMSEISLSENPSYIHITSNNTIFGTQWRDLPSFGPGKMIADMSSDILSRNFNVTDFGLIYAGAQKNLGPSGVTVVLISPEMLEKSRKDLPTMLRYDIHAKNNSLYNTPPVIGVYVLGLVLKWVKNNGGLNEMNRINEEKASLIYDTIDASGGFYRGHAKPGSRSIMNVTFRLPNEELESTFVSQSSKAGLVGLKGHRSVGGLRASIYNAMPIEGCASLADFMKEFQRVNG